MSLHSSTGRIRRFQQQLVNLAGAGCPQEQVLGKGQARRPLCGIRADG